ncbi:MAG TPA: hypothetical protein VMP03_07745 [Methylomirabilota bacterium]|nr:hypothetical protein [Methylomirabilota bacterium]
MTSILAVRKSRSIEVMADAAIYDARGVVLSIESKILSMPRMSAVVTGRGVFEVVRAFAQSAAGLCRSFDDLIASYPKVLELIEGPGRTRFGEWFSSHEIIIAGWSESREGPEIHVGVGHRRVADIEPGRLHKFDSFLCAGPMPPWDEVLSRGWSNPETTDDFRADQDGLAIFEAQRLTIENLQTPNPDAEGFSVGGFVELATVTESEVSRRVIREWPDRVGYLIDPFVKTAA